jgi:ADP-ribose pyrophosphatase YjhB (NUDIX family)
MSHDQQTSDRLTLTVAAIAERQGRFLLVEERIRGRLVINQPAGHVERGETIATAVVRETLEESAHHFAPEAIIGVYRYRGSGSGETFLRVAFSGSVDSQLTDRVLDRGIERVLWLSQAQLVAQRHRLRSPMVLRCIEDYVAGQRFDPRLFADLDLPGLAGHAAVI